MQTNVEDKSLQNPWTTLAASTISGVLGFFALASNIGTELLGLYADPQKRFVMWGLCLALFAVAIFYPIARYEGAANKRRKLPYRPNWLWLIPFFVVLLFGYLDVHTYLNVPMAKVGFKSRYGIGESFEHLPPIINDSKAMIEEAEGISIAPDTIYEFDSPFIGPLITLAGDSQSIFTSQLDKEYAKSIYGNTINEHFRFEIQRNNKFKEVEIQNIEVVVHNYIPLPTFVTPGGGQAMGPDKEHDILLYLLKPKTGQPLPWRYTPNWHLDDYDSLSVLPWGELKTPTLSGDFSRIFFGKFFSPIPGIYEYTVAITLVKPFGKSESIEIPSNGEKRFAVFTEIKTVDEYDQSMLKKYAGQEIQKKYGDYVDTEIHQSNDGPFEFYVVKQWYPEPEIVLEAPASD